MFLMYFVNEFELDNVILCYDWVEIFGKKEIICELFDFVIVRVVVCILVFNEFCLLFVKE